METKVEKLQEATYKITVTIPQEEVSQTRKRIIGETVSTSKIKGFREGKAPKNLVEKQLDESKIRGEIINRLLPEAYLQVIKEHHLKPITQPRINIKKFESAQDLVLEVMVVERPEVKIEDYKRHLGDLKSKITTQESDKDDEPQKIEEEAILKTLLEISEVALPDLLVDDEVNNMLSRLVDQTARLGLTVEQYLTSSNKTVEQLREEYKKSAKQNLKAEFILSELIKRENIQVSEAEIKETLNANPDRKTREELEKKENRWYIESVIKKRKLIQKLIDIAERRQP